MLKIGTLNNTAKSRILLSARLFYRGVNISPLLFICIFLLYSCGGGSSSQETVNNENNTINSNNELNENCINTSRQGLQRCDLEHDGIDRYYFIYSPQNNDASLNLPILLALHGYGSSAQNHYSYTNYFPIADQNNFIVLYPQGSPMQTNLASSSSHWNVGGWTIGSSVDDISFIDKVLNLVKNKTSINESRIYSSGMSNGGFMSYHLACKLSNRIAAIASVTGSMTPETFDDCDPKHPTAILQIHGARDLVVPYSGLSYMKSIPDSIEYWSNVNGCNNEPNVAIIDDFENNFSITETEYLNCLSNVSVKLLYHSTMGHTWPAANTFGISASSEVWNFVSQYNLFGKIN
mgnify:CR=1 FL=1|tara:strand:+ start:748 stop:1794 length:1047 start_codon:yes stop_codon:yes gene_type:complete